MYIAHVPLDNALVLGNLKFSADVEENAKKGLF